MKVQRAHFILGGILSDQRETGEPVTVEQLAGDFADQEELEEAIDILLEEEMIEERGDGYWVL